MIDFKNEILENFRLGGTPKTQIDRLNKSANKRIVRFIIRHYVIGLLTGIGIAYLINFLCQ